MTLSHWSIPFAMWFFRTNINQVLQLLICSSVICYNKGNIGKWTKEINGNIGFAKILGKMRWLMQVAGWSMVQAREGPVWGVWLSFRLCWRSRCSREMCLVLFSWRSFYIIYPYLSYHRRLIMKISISQNHGLISWYPYRQSILDILAYWQYWRQFQPILLVNIISGTQNPIWYCWYISESDNFWTTAKMIVLVYVY